MKESEFLELLNLYLDHEITAEDAARLEAEVMRSPERRRTYRQYCMMQKACAGLASKFTEDAPAENVVPFAAPRRRLAPIYLATGLAAAACLAVTFVVFKHGGGSTGGVVQPTDAGAQITSITPVAQPVAKPELKKVLSMPGAAELPSNRELVPVSYNLADARAQFDWLNGVQVSPAQNVNPDSLKQIFKADLKFTPDVAPRSSGVTAEQAAFEFKR